MPEPSLLPLRIAVVDDEPLARAVLCEFLAAEPNVEVVAQCANGFEAVKAVSELTPDLLLLDVQMPKLDGFEVLDLVGRDVAVVFTTAYDQYALRAFEVHAVDYLLKPISAERLSEALVRVRERLGRGERAASPGAHGRRQAAGGTCASRARAGRSAGARDSGGQDRLRAGAGRLCVLQVRGQGLPEGADARRRRRRRSTRRRSSGSTARICSTSRGWCGSIRTSGRTAWRCSPTAAGCR